MKVQKTRRLVQFAAVWLSVMMSILAGRAHADTFVLVHGAFQRGADWGSVVPHLESAGNTVVMIDLPGRNAEGEVAKGVSLQSYVDTVTDVVSTADKPVHLVGHSFGGITISSVAEAMPDTIETLIYVAAYVPEDGESMEKLAYSDTDNGFTDNSFVVAKDYSHATILKEDQARLFANDADADQIRSVHASMIKEPLPPIGTPVSLTKEKFGSVKQAYVRTLRDQTVSTPMQTKMLMRAAIENVVDLDTGHLPYLTAPDRLATAILELATSN